MAKKIGKNNWVGMKFRNLPEYNYSAIWNNLVTIRLDKGEVMELPPDKSEFYDVSLGTKCTTSCIRTKVFNNTQINEYKEFIRKNSENIIYIKHNEDGSFRIDYYGSSACPFCYVSANPNGRYYESICETWKKWMNLYKNLIINK